MIAAALAPVLVGLILRWSAPAVVLRCRPAVAARVLVAASLVTALATGLALSAVAALTVAELPVAGRAGHWSTAWLAARAPVPPAVGAAVGVIVAALLAASVVVLVGSVRRTASASRAARALGPGSGGLVVLDDERPGAYAVPGAGGRVVVTRALLRRLDGAERRAVLAHEAAHLRHRHHVYVQLARLAAAADPVLRPVSRSVRLAVECWADADAAAEVGDPAVVARALARVGVARAGAPGVALAATGSDLRCRVARLTSPSGDRTTPIVGGVALGTAGAVVSALVLAVDAHGWVEQAQTVYRTARGS